MKPQSQPQWLTSSSKTPSSECHQLRANSSDTGAYSSLTPPQCPVAFSEGPSVISGRDKSCASVQGCLCLLRLGPPDVEDLHIWTKQAAGSQTHLCSACRLPAWSSRGSKMHSERFGDTLSQVNSCYVSMRTRVRIPSTHIARVSSTHL